MAKISPNNKMKSKTKYIFRIQYIIKTLPYLEQMGHIFKIKDYISKHQKIKKGF